MGHGIMHPPLFLAIPSIGLPFVLQSRVGIIGLPFVLQSRVWIIGLPFVLQSRVWITPPTVRVTEPSVDNSSSVGAAVIKPKKSVFKLPGNKATTRVKDITNTHSGGSSYFKQGFNGMGGQSTFCKLLVDCFENEVFALKMLFL